MLDPGDPHLANLCEDCHSAEASTDARKRRLCQACFVRYITSKAIKRIESYRLKDDASEQPRLLLLPVSGGTSSVILLHILDEHIRQKSHRRRHTAYRVLVLMVEMPPSRTQESNTQSFDHLRHHFLSHSFSLLPLSAVFDFDEGIYEDLDSLNGVDKASPEASLVDLISSTTTQSAMTDVLDILLTRLVVTFAKANKCEAILWGHSTTCLAAKTLAAVAKGRGGSLPTQISDGLSPWGVRFFYPLRDLFKPELVIYSKFLPGILPELTSQTTTSGPSMTSIRNTSINDLLSKYISTQGERYPSIMANVVRTTSKLQAPKSAIDSAPCSICASPRRQEDTGDRLTGMEDKSMRLCFACQRVKSEMKQQGSS